jgi:acetylglutamate kinase
MGAVPVIAPLTHDGNGQMLNTNADTMAATVATALAPYYDVTLTYCFEKAGVLKNPDDDSSLIPVITADDFKSLVDNGTVSGGMIPKIENALSAVNQGVKKVVITSANNLEGGTTIR